MFASGSVGTKYMNMAVVHPHATSPYVSVWNISPVAIGTSTTRFTKIADPSVLPTSGANYCDGAHFNCTGDILAVTHTASPYVKFYERNGDVLTALPDITNGPVSTPSRGGCWHPEGNIFVSVFDNYPRIHISKRSATTSTRFETLSTASIFFNSQMPPVQAWGCCWNPQGNILTIGLYNSPFWIAYWWDGSMFTKLADPAIMPTGGADSPGTTWSRDGTVVVQTHAISPWVTAYWVNYNGTATTFTKLANPASLPGSTAQSVCMNNTGSSFVHSMYNSPYNHCYNISYNGTLTTLTRVASFPTIPGGGGYSQNWLPDDKSYILGAYNAPRFQYITRSGDTFTVQGSMVPNVLQPNATNGPGSLWPKAGNPTK